MRSAHIALATTLSLLSGCSSDSPDSAGGPSAPAASPPWFVEVAEERGLTWVHSKGDEVRYWFPEVMGPGAGVLDYDRDGDMDLYLVQSGDLSKPEGENAGDRLFANDGAGNFADVTEATGATDRGYGMGCACGDYDGDGWTDIYVTNVGPNALLKNGGAGAQFSSVAAAAGVDDDRWGTSAAFMDIDNDGDLDLFVVNYLNWSEAVELKCMSGFGEPDYCHPNNYNSPATDVLFENNGDGTFTDITARAGVAEAFGNGLGVAPGDFNSDGLMDIYVANDMTANQLWMNQGDNTFKESGLLAGCAVNGEGAAEAGMGVVAFDAENDGDLDLYLTHLREQTNTLYINQGGGFTDKTSIVGLAGPSLRFTGFGTGAADFDQDGMLDLYAANGRVGKWRPQFLESDPYAEPDQVYRGVGAGRFKEIMPQGGTGEPYYANSRGMAFVDTDGDGDLDVVVADNHGRVRLLENVAPGQGNSVLLEVVNEAGAPAVGAKVSISVGGETLVRFVQPAFSYCSSSDPRVHFGLGEHTGTFDLRIDWPGGDTTERAGLQSGGVVRISR
ncbi:MAG: CRTAC1 family protein [Planctomycetes bacterium]|nr:CRTAC1 family protein [Planctomycetota bacterium]